MRRDSSKKKDAFRPLSRLALESADATSLRCSGPGMRLELRVLAEDLFRLRLTSASTLSDLPSWAVTKTSWAPPQVKVTHSRGRVALQTTEGRFSLQLADGGWEIKDRFGLTLFDAPPGSTGFAEHAPRTALSLEDDETIF